MKHFDYAKLRADLREKRSRMVRHSLRAAAEEIGLSHSGYDKIESGERKPGVDALYALTAWLGTSTESYRTSELQDG